MLIEEAEVYQSLRRIITRFRADSALQDDLMQECLVRLWRLETEEPGRTRSWYLQNCRYHLQHWLAAGRSLDSLKRTDEDKRISIDWANDELPLADYHTNGEFMQIVSARDISATLARHLKPPESDVLSGLADGLRLSDVAVKLHLSYPTALKYRRKIAALAIRLGINPPANRSQGPRRDKRAGGVEYPYIGKVQNGTPRDDHVHSIRRRSARGGCRGSVRPLVRIPGPS